MKNRICSQCGKNFIVLGKFFECSPECRIKSKIEIKNDCWIWKGFFRGIYGTVSFKGKCMSAHRMSYFVFKGEIPKKIYVLHKCDTPACVNPEHLFLGTNKENTKDMIKKNRHPFNFVGEKNNMSILTENQVLEIRRLHKEGYKIKDLAKKFNVKYFTCVDVVNRRNWRHI
jgi:hypothetical protein